MRLMSILSIALVGIIFISSQSTPAFAENSTSISNYTDPIVENYTEPEIIPDPIVENYTEPEIIPDPIVENYTEPESNSESIQSRYQPPTNIPGLEIKTTMNIEIKDDKVIVWGVINPDKIIFENGPSLQIIKSDGTGSLVTAKSSSFVWDGLYYSTFSFLSNFKDVQDQTIFKLWSGNGAKGEVLIEKTALITIPEPETAPIVENYTEPITTNEPPLTNGTTTVLSNSNYTEPELVTELYTQKDQPIELWSDKSVYEDGSIIQIEGKINDGTSLIHVKVYNPSNLNISDESYTVPNNGIFELNFDTSNYLWYENGIYLIQVEDIDGEKSQVEALVLDVALELESTQQNNTISQINSTSQFGNEVDQLREENKTLQEELERQREQIDELNEEVDYLKNIIESIQGFFDSIFS